MSHDTSPSERKQAARSTALRVQRPEQDLPSELPVSPSRLRSQLRPRPANAADPSGAGRGCKSRTSRGDGACPALAPGSHGNGAGGHRTEGSARPCAQLLGQDLRQNKPRAIFGTQMLN